MEINRTIEQRLWKVSPINHLDKDSSDQIIEYLLGSLSVYLKQPLKLVGENWLHEGSFSADFVGAIMPYEPFRITFVGTLGMQLIGDEFIPHVSAWLFPFGDHQRLTAGESNRSFISFSYVRDSSSVGAWQSHGWQIDEFHEFEEIDEKEFR